MRIQAWSGERHRLEAKHKHEEHIVNVQKRMISGGWSEYIMQPGWKPGKVFAPFFFDVTLFRSGLPLQSFFSFFISFLLCTSLASVSSLENTVNG